MKYFRKRIKYLLCTLLAAIMLLPVLSLTAHAADFSYELGFVDLNGNRLYGQITVYNVYETPTKTLTTNQYNETVTFGATSGHEYHVTFTNADGYYGFYSFRASQKDYTEQDRSAARASLARAPYTVTVKYTDGTAASGVQVTDDNNFAVSLDNKGTTTHTSTTTNSNGQCTVYGNANRNTVVTVTNGFETKTQTINPANGGSRNLTFTLETRVEVPVKVMLDGQDVTAKSKITAVSGSETVTDANGKLFLAKGSQYAISASHSETGTSAMGFPITKEGGFTTSVTNYSVPQNPSALTLNATLSKPVPYYNDYSVQQAPFRYPDGSTLELAYGKKRSFDIENEINGATYTVQSSNPDVLSVTGYVLEAKAAGEATLTVKVQYLNSSATSTITVKVLKTQIDVPFSGDVLKTYTYNGQTQTMNLPESNAYTITGNKQTNAGTHEVRIALKDKVNTEWKPFLGTGSSSEDYIWSFVIGKADLTAADLLFAQPDNLVYDGSPKEAAVALKSGKTGAGALTLTYFDANGTKLDGAPAAIGTYTVKVSAAEGTNFKAAADLADPSWKFTVQKDSLTAEDFLCTLPQGGIYDGSQRAAEVALKPHITGAGEITVRYLDIDSNVILDTAPVDAGRYRVIVSAAEGEIYRANDSITDPQGGWEFTVGRAEGAASVSADDTVYGKSAIITPTSQTNGTEGVTYWFKTKNAGDDTYDQQMPVNAGEYTVKAVFPQTKNYNEVTAFDDFKILPRQITVKADDAKKTYGDEDPDSFGYTLIAGDLVGVNNPTLILSREAGENAGEYTITVSQAQGANPNFDITFESGIFTIEKAKLIVTAEDKTVVYGDPTPQYTASFTGLRRGDTEDLFAQALRFDCEYTPASDKGEYAITPKGCESANYAPEYVPGKLTVSPKPITEADVTLGEALTYSGKEQTQTVNVTDGITYEVRDNTATNAGTYTLTVAGTGNYTGEVKCPWEMKKAPLTIAVPDRIIYLGEAIPTFTYTVSGLCEADTLTTEPTVLTDADAEQAGTYSVTVSGAGAGENYEITYVDGTLTVLDQNSQVETKVVKTELTEVPQGLMNTEFSTVAAIKEALLSRILLANDAFTDGNVTYYDVILQYSLDGGQTWIAATAESFPTEGITLVLPYPEGTNAKEYEFLVSHMFTVTSNRLGIRAGEVEQPAAEETENGLRVTLKGLSPVAVAARYHDHTGGTATCADQAICTVCEKAYGEPDADNHTGGTEVRNASEPTCGAEGYTGDICCKGCGEPLEKGSAIKATGEHDYGKWKVVKKATETKKGEKQRTCGICGHVDVKEIPVLSNSPATGDDFSIVLHGGLLTVSLVGFVALLLASKKRRQEKA